MEINPILDGGNCQYAVQKFGKNFDVDTGTVPEDIWTPGGILDDSAITPPLTIASDNAADTAAGTGLRTVNVQGVDTNGDYIETDITMNGLASVALNDFAFVNRMRGLTAGSNGRNVGTINVTDNGALVVSQMAPDTGQTLQAIFCNPGNWPALRLVTWYASIGRQAATQADFELIVNPYRFFTSDGVVRNLNTIELNAQGSTFAQILIDPDCGRLQPLDILRIRVLDVTTNTTRCSGGFGLKV